MKIKQKNKAKQNKNNHSTLYYGMSVVETTTWSIRYSLCGDIIKFLIMFNLNRMKGSLFTSLNNFMFHATDVDTLANMWILSKYLYIQVIHEIF